MGDYIKKVFTQIFDFFGSLSAERKIAIGVIGAGIIAAISMMMMWAGERTYAPLMNNLGPEDAANVIRVLRDKRIPFRVDQSGRNISVPPESVDQLRLELAVSGLPQSGTVGYEVFDKQSLGTTSFVQKINQKRALEGELMRTISSIHGVRNTRVHLAIPQKSTFVEDQKKSTASVVLDLEPGVTLTDRQIIGIGNLVARAVEGMDSADVVIVDSIGKQLSKNSNDTLAQAGATQLEFKQKMENETERRIEEMLARVVGEGRVVARVSADVDFSQVNETQTTYDADGSAVRSVQHDDTSSAQDRPGAAPVARARSNLPDASQPVASNGIKTDTKKNFNITNYEIPQIVKRTIKPQGSVKKMSIAVVVDGKRTKVPGKDGAPAESKVEPWGAEKLKEFETIVATAAGIDRKRGDTIEIKNMEFTQEDFAEAQAFLAAKEKKTWIQNLVLYSVIGLTIILFFMLVVRPFIKWVTENTVDSVETYLPQTIEELERIQKNSVIQGLEDAVPEMPDRVDPDKVEGEMLREKIMGLVDANPHKAALVLKEWLHGAENAAAKKAAGGKEEGKSASA